MRSRFFPVLPFVLVLAMSGCGYNQIQTLDERAAQAKQQITVQLQRRHDLIGNLVNTVKGHAAHEEAVFTRVAEARAGLANAVSRGDPQEMAQANEQVTGALRQFMVTVEAYPQLKADQSFLRLQDELTGTENRIAVARTDYNQTAGEYNTYIRRFPAALTAKVTGAKPREYFDVTNPAALEAPTVDFSKTPGKTP